MKILLAGVVGYLAYDFSRKLPQHGIDGIPAPGVGLLVAGVVYMIVKRI